MQKIVTLFLLLLSLATLSGCVESVTVDTKDKVPPKASLLASSQYTSYEVVTDDGQTATLKCGVNEPVAILATGYDPSGVRSVTLTAVSGGILLDERGARMPTITVEKDTTPQGKAVNRIIFQAKVEFDSPQQDLVLRVSALDWAGNTVITPVLRLEQHQMPAARISVSSNVINYGESVVVNYETENAQAVFLNGQQLGTHNGTKTFPNLTETTLYTLRAEGVTGTATASANVFVNPKPNACVIQRFSINTSSVDLGQSVKLSWKCNDCASVSISPINFTSTSDVAEGTLNVTPTSLGTMTYTMTATGPGGTSTDYVMVNVYAPEDDQECFRTNNMGGLFSFSRTAFLPGNNVNVSQWKMDLSILLSSGKIKSITNRSVPTVVLDVVTQPALNYTLVVGGRAKIITPGETTDFFNGIDVNSVYEVEVWDTGDEAPAYIDIEVCYE